MASFSCHFNSSVLELKTQLEILIPDDIKEGERIKVLYLLHGYFGNQTDWIRLSNIELYIRPYRVAVVMPSVHNSYYTDMKYGAKYFTYIAEELPRFIENTLPVSKKREDHYICGLSMGGYGALKVALTYPNKFKMAASLSGALNIERIQQLSVNDGRYDKFIGIYGQESVKDTPNDLKYLISNMKNADKDALDFFIGCGTEDFLYQDNLDFVAFLKEQSVKHIYVESKGTHDWYFWDSYVQKVLKY
ncbi:MAG: esterase family protein, partial [Acholeplasmataceae bacterium]|nr:esterase family protein [Acholeplasmataceae bacterium]